MFVFISQLKFVLYEICSACNFVLSQSFSYLVMGNPVVVKTEGSINANTIARYKLKYRSHCTGVDIVTTWFNKSSNGEHSP